MSDTICILPLDKDMGAEFLAKMVKMCKAFFHGCKVKLLPPFAIDSIKKIEKRVFPGDPYAPDIKGLVQYDASKILSWLFRVYKPKYPKSVCIIAITNQDLYCEDFSFVFGLANVMTQSGIFSFCRYNPAFNQDEVESEEDAENLILYRACKVMTHEIGHMFGIRHCIYYECAMNGCNHIEECQSRPF